VVISAGNATSVSTGRRVLLRLNQAGNC
jgi:hypothetical protein